MITVNKLLDQEVTCILEISPNDLMYKNDPDYYFWKGRNAINCIRIALLTAGKESPTTLLDLPCGHGRVLRMLKAAFPNASITACDIDKDGVDFCARVFGATPVYSNRHPSEIDVGGPFDLIWCGSLLTHLGVEGWTGFLKLFDSLLAPDGMLLFSTHGPHFAQLLRDKRKTLGLRPDAISILLQEYDSHGFGYHDYSYGSNYGIALAKPSWVCLELEQLPTLRLHNYFQRGFGAQDIFSCVRATRGTTYVGVHGKTDCEWVSGWAWNKENAEMAVSVDIFDGKRLLGTIRADRFRQDLLDARIGTGKYGFAYRIPESLKDGQPHVLRVTVSGTSIELKHTPRTIICPPLDEVTVQNMAEK